MKPFILATTIVFASLFLNSRCAQLDAQTVNPTRVEIAQPIRNESFNKGGTCRIRKQGGNPRQVNGYLVFDGSQDGNQQVDPQIAVGGGYVLHGSNSGLIIYDKNGQFVSGVKQDCFKGGIDPKLFFDPHNRVFGFDLWSYWEKPNKPVNISVSETDDPRGAWNTYQIPAPEGRDGGGIGYSKKWIGYSFPGGTEQTFVMKMDEAKSGKPASVYHFAGNLGQPVMTQDDIEDLYFFKLTNREFKIVRVTADEQGNPMVGSTVTKPHNLKQVAFPPKSPQQGTDKTLSSGDRNPKANVIQNGHFWFSQTINFNGVAAVQWHQVKLDGSIVQTGLIHHETNSYIQTTLAVNKAEDVLIGFQEAGTQMFVSPRFAFRRASDEPGTTREIVNIGEGQGANQQGGPWGDYSGSTIDGDNLSDLWTIQSITDKDGKGDTVIAKIPFGENDK